MRKLLAIGFILVCFGALSACSNSGANAGDLKTSVLNQSTSGKYALLEPKAAADLINNNAALGLNVVDVRTESEFKSGCISGAKNIDVQASDFDNKIAALDKAKPYLVYCRAGHRSATAIAKMKAAGFSNLYEVAGGFNAWKEGGQAVSAKCE